MQLFIGVDEAGYGPNLGPLLIGGTAWLAPKSMNEEQFCRAFSGVFRALPLRPNCKHVPLGDSKKLYQPGIGLGSLEAGLLAMLHQILPEFLQGNQSSLRILLDAIQIPAIQSESPAAPKNQPKSNTPPWYHAIEQISVPKDTQVSEIERLSILACQALELHDIQLIDMRCVVVTEPQFNHCVGELQSKGQLLSKATLGLVASLLESHQGYSAKIFCDRQGGRKNYLPILLDAMPDIWFSETLSSSRRSSYQSVGEPSYEVHFSVGGDSFPPTALASMLAKYLRERLMDSFNAFWSEHVPNIKPTAGYPLDAKRFRAEIDTTAATLALAPETWWRSR